LSMTTALFLSLVMAGMILVSLALIRTILSPSFMTTLPPPPTPTLFPYTTLFRSAGRTAGHARGQPDEQHGQRDLDDVPDPVDPEIGRAHAELQSRENLVCRLLLEKKKSNTLSKSQNTPGKLTAKPNIASQMHSTT